MSTIIICLVCVALLFGVEYFERRHMRLFKLKAEHQSGEDIATAVEQVYYGGKESDKREAEQLRTRKTKYVFWALIIFLGVASIVFVNFKDQWLGEWKSFFSSENKVEVKAPITKADDYSLSVWDYLAAYFSHEKALEYYGTKRGLAYNKAMAELQKCEETLKQAQERQVNPEIGVQLARKAKAKTNLEKAKKDFENLVYFSNNWEVNSRLNWIFPIFLLCFSFNFYVLNKNLKRPYLGYAIFGSVICFVVGLVLEDVLRDDYKGEFLFTVRDGLNIAFMIGSLVFLILFMAKNSD